MNGQLALFEDNIENIWEKMSELERFNMLDNWAGIGTTDIGDRYKNRKWGSFNVGEQNTLTALCSSCQKVVSSIAYASFTKLVSYMATILYSFPCIPSLACHS